MSARYHVGDKANNAEVQVQGALRNRIFLKESWLDVTGFSWYV